MKNIIHLFNTIRDIPYSIPILDTDTDECCSGKHRILKRKLESLGFQSRYRVCHFRWSESMHLPKELKDVMKSDDNTHVYLEVYIDNKWVNIDATWDIGVKHILPVNETWDGLSDTKIAVLPRELFSLKESEDIMTKPNKKGDEDDMKINKEFYLEFNKWLKKERKK